MQKSKMMVIGVAFAVFLSAFILMNLTSAPAPRPEPVQPELAQAPAPPKIETEDVLVSGHEIPMGRLVKDNDFSWQTWPRDIVSSSMITRSNNPNIINELKGSVARFPFLEGEPIRREKLVKSTNSGYMSVVLPQGYRAVAINIDQQGSTSAGGFILPNDRVDIIQVKHETSTKGAAGLGQGGGDNTFSETILQNIRVLAIGQNVQERNGERVITGSTATLELTPVQAEMIVAAQRTGGALTLALRSILDNDISQAAKRGDAIERGLTVVRYGVSEQAIAKQ